jgi:hypothetical protein
MFLSFETHVNTHITMIWLMLILNVWQYYLYPVQAETCTVHGMINHCDRHITLLSDTDISLNLFNLFTYFEMPFGW